MTEAGLGRESEPLVGAGPFAAAGDEVAPVRLTLRDAKALWPQWQALHDQQRERGRLAAMEKFGSSVVASFLLDMHLPNLPPPAEAVAYALQLECGHEAYGLAKKGVEPSGLPQPVRCPAVWNCYLSSGRSAVRYLAPHEPKPKYADLGIFSWHVKLDCGHAKPMLLHESESFSAGDLTECHWCQPELMGVDVRVTAIGKRLPDPMVQSWDVELDCGHTGTDHLIPVEDAADPAEYRARHPRLTGLSCLSPDCGLRQVFSLRRLGLIGKVRAPQAQPLAPVDSVRSAANDIRRRLTLAQRQELVRLLEAEQ